MGEVQSGPAGPVGRGRQVRDDHAGHRQGAAAGGKLLDDERLLHRFGLQDVFLLHAAAIVDDRAAVRTGSARDLSSLSDRGLADLDGLKGVRKLRRAQVRELVVGREVDPSGFQGRPVVSRVVAEDSALLAKFVLEIGNDRRERERRVLQTLVRSRRRARGVEGTRRDSLSRCEPGRSDAMKRMGPGFHVIRTDGKPEAAGPTGRAAFVRARR
jgi:hypothetical protein